VAVVDLSGVALEGVIPRELATSGREPAPFRPFVAVEITLGVAPGDRSSSGKLAIRSGSRLFDPPFCRLSAVSTSLACSSASKASLLAFALALLLRMPKAAEQHTPNTEAEASTATKAIRRGKREAETEGGRTCAKRRAFETVLFGVMNGY